MAALTAAEKILSAHVGREHRAGEIVVVPVDAVMAQDGNAPLAIQLFYDELGGTRTFDPERVVLVIDHCGPSPNDGASNLQKMMRNFAREAGARIFDIGQGISHVLLPEHGYSWPGAVVLGSDSHAVAYGAFNCFGTGMGSTDIAVAIRTGKTWMRVPQSVLVTFTGAFQPGVTAKDLTLELVRQLGPDGATYMALEFAPGPSLSSLGLDGRLTMCSMAVEVGAKACLMPVDVEVEAYLSSRPRLFPHLPIEGVTGDPGAHYARRVEIDLGALEPLVAVPHDLTRIEPAREHGGVRVNQAFLGTCTNSRLSDLRLAAETLRGHRVHPDVRFVVTPGSVGVFRAAMAEGLLDVFLEAGAVVTPPGCGPCVGTHMGIPADDDIVISSANRNFRGRMGNPRSSIFLGSPATVAASAVAGHIATADEVAGTAAVLAEVG